MGPLWTELHGTRGQTEASFPPRRKGLRSQCKMAWHQRPFRWPGLYCMGLASRYLQVWEVGAKAQLQFAFDLKGSSHRQQDTSYWGSQQADWTPRTTPPDSAAQVTGTCSRPGCAPCLAGLRRNSPHLPLSEVRSKPKKPFSPALPVRQAGRQSKEHGGGGEGGCAFWEATHN